MKALAAVAPSSQFLVGAQFGWWLAWRWIIPALGI